jgi:predicted peptidase
MRWFAAIVAFVLSGSAASAQTGFLDKVHKGADGKEHKYVLFVPHDYKSDKSRPLILFLHGAGERGTDGKRPSQVGIGPAIRKLEKTFPFITVMPQAEDPKKGSWRAEGDDAKRALAIVAEVEKEYKVDAERKYLTGLSMGGYGTWSIAVTHPKMFAAIAPVCGGGDPKRAAEIARLPCWCFHGDADKAVPVTRSREMIEALKAAGGMPKYDEYAGVGHNSWDKAYGTAELWPWLLSHKVQK